jgi:hypothetical protein
MAGAGLFSEKSTVGWLLVGGGWFVLREKYCWLVADKPSEQGGCFERHAHCYKELSTFTCYSEKNLFPFTSYLHY